MIDKEPVARTVRRVLPGSRCSSSPTMSPRTHPRGRVHLRRWHRARRRAGEGVSGNSTSGLVDEIPIHPVPVLFGVGTLMFEPLGGEHIQLKTAEMIETPSATHLRFRIVK